MDGLVISIKNGGHGSSFADSDNLLNLLNSKVFLFICWVVLLFFLVRFWFFLRLDLPH